jgi:hypothetical protein
MRSNVARAAGSASSAAAKSAGTATSRGAVSRAISTSTSSPPLTPAASRTSALTPTLNDPLTVAIEVRYVYPLIVTVTAGFLPAPSSATISSGTVMPVAVLPPCSTVAWKRIGRL